MSYKTINEIEEKEDYAILHVYNKNNSINIYIDKADIDLIKQYHWSIFKDIRGNINVYSHSKCKFKYNFMSIKKLYFGSNNKTILKYMDGNKFNWRRNNLYIKTKLNNNILDNKYKLLKCIEEHFYYAKSINDNKEYYIIAFEYNSRLAYKAFNIKVYGKEKAFNSAFTYKQKLEKSINDLIKINKI